LAIPSHRAIVTWLLIASNVIVWLLMEINGGSEHSRTLIIFGAKVNALINDGEWWRLVTSMFLHIGIIHLAVNCFSLYNVGSLLERFIGSVRFAVIYLLAGICGSLASYWFSPLTISAGASGAIFGLLGAVGVFFFLHRKLFGAAANRLLTNIAVVALLNLSLGASLSGIDNYAHLGGLMGGLAVSVLLVPRFTVQANSFGQPVIVGQQPPLAWLWILLFAVGLAFLTVIAISVGSNSPAAHLERGEQFFTECRA
jgi:rhomboid protease GluP